jgi:flagellar biosynthesis/type III secretory pathway M-ring protein FliF/YscJ
MTGDPVFITAQEAAERLLTIKIGGIIIFSAIVLGGIWFLLVWKYGEDRRREEAQNEKDRISVTKNIGVSMAKAIEKDGGWKEQYFILKKKYDVLEAHCENLEQLLDSAEAGKFVPKGGKA